MPLVITGSLFVTFFQPFDQHFSPALTIQSSLNIKESEGIYYMRSHTIFLHPSDYERAMIDPVSTVTALRFVMPVDLHSLANETRHLP